MKLAQWIDGKARPPASGAYLEDVAPATGEVLALVPCGDARDVEAAVQAARRALEQGWGKRPAAERAELLEAAARRISERAGELAEMEARDTGKPLSLAAAVDLPRAVENFRFFAAALRQDATECHPMAGALNYSLRRPLGVVGLITPWNLPLYLLSWKAAPALAMGNAVVAKPSELTPLSAASLAEILSEVGFPPGVFNLVHGRGAEAGQALVEHPGVAAVSFTGGTATGARVAASAAPGFKKLSLELGGKNPTVVFADCDFEKTVAGTARAAFLNQGQICLCGSRVLVERPIFQRFTAALVERARAMKVGDPMERDSDLGSLISAAHRDKVEGYLHLAREEGGTILCGGARPKLAPPCERGAFLTPAVIAGLDTSCRTVQEEIFGPVVTVHPFDTEEEALALANGVRYGLAASLWTRDLGRAHRVAAALDTGMVWVNTWLKRDLRVPFGGSKQSGLGREGGHYSLDFYSEVRNVCVELGS